MSPSDLTRIVNKMAGKMPESSRALLAHLLLKQFAFDLREKDGKLFNSWADGGGPKKFITVCRLEGTLPHVPCDMEVSDSALAEFCNRWMNFKSTTPEQRQIRYTMVEELKRLASDQKAELCPQE